MTTITFDLSETIARRIRKSDLSVALRTERLTPEIARKIFLYGFGQKVGDKFSDAVKGAAKVGMDVDIYAQVMAQKTIDQLESGVWRGTRSAGVTTSPLEAEAERIAATAVKTSFGKLDAKDFPVGTFTAKCAEYEIEGDAEDDESRKDMWDALVDAVAGLPAILEKAQEVIDLKARQAAAKASVKF